MKLSLSAKTYIGFAAVLVTLLTVGVLSYWMTAELVRTNREVGRTHEDLQRLESLNAASVTAESARRGYILTGDEIMLEPYRQAVLQISTEMSALRRLSNDNPSRLKELDALELLLTERLKQLGASIEDQRKRGSDPRVQIPGTHEGAALQARVRQSISAIEDEERYLLRRRTEAAEQTVRMTLMVITVSGLLAFCVAVVATVRINLDILERRRSQIALAEAHMKLQSVLDAATLVAVIATDLNGVITTFNRGAERMLGYSSDELVGKQTPMIFHLESEIAERGRQLTAEFGREIRGFEAFVERARRGGPEMSAWTYVRKDGAQLRVNLAVTPVFDDRHRITGFLGVAADITERIRFEQALYDREEQIRLLLDSTAEAIYGIDLEGRCTFCNPSCLRILGYKEPWNLLGKNMHDLIHHSRPDGRPLPVQECRIYQSFREGQGTHIDDEVLWRADGTSFAAEYWSYPVRKGGELAGSVVTFLDITERRAVERMKNEFVSIVSHELRTPLTSIRGALGLLAGGLLQSQPEKSKRMLDIAASNTDRLVRLINDILDLERMESGKAPPQLAPCRAGDLMTLAAETVHAIAEQAGLTISVLPQPFLLRADADRILATLTNLLGNAIKFSPHGGKIWVTAERRGKEVLFGVRDEGRGIPADKLESIFERFQQVDASDSRQKGGTGLGLAICRKIVQQHGGRIWVESVLGKGSTFFFTLPCVDEAEPADSGGQPGMPLVLVYSDDESLRRVVGAMLESRDYRVITSETGGEAVDLALAQRPELVLLDSTMPQTDGREMMVALQAHPEISGIPVVILNVLSAEEVKAFPGTVAGWIEKPLDQTALFQSVERALEAKANKAHVLVVEDDLDLARVLAAMFERRGIGVFHARTGREAIDISAKLDPDLLVLDLVLPEGDGFAVVDWLRRNDRLRLLPLVVYTALELSAGDRERLKLGPTQFLTKSRVSPAEFEDHVMALLDKVLAEGKKEARHDG